MEDQPVRERRSAYRVWMEGKEIVCHHPNFAARYHLTNLSTTGALIEQGPMMTVGDRVMVRLNPRATDNIWAAARVVRRETANEKVVGLRFVDLTKAEYDAIHDLMVDAMIGRWQAVRTDVQSTML